MNKTLKIHLYCLFAYVCGFFVSQILLVALLTTVFCSILGTEEAGIPAAQSASLFFILPVAWLMIYLYKRNSVTGWRAYNEKIKADRAAGIPAPTVREDLRALLKSADIIAESIFIAVATVIFWLFHFRYFFILLNIPLYYAFGVVTTLRIRRLWLRDCQVD